MYKTFKIYDVVVLLDNNVLIDVFRNVNPGKAKSLGKRGADGENCRSNTEWNNIERNSVCTQIKDLIKWLTHMIAYFIP